MSRSLVFDRTKLHLSTCQEKQSSLISCCYYHYHFKTSLQLNILQTTSLLLYHCNCAKIFVGAGSRYVYYDWVGVVQRRNFVVFLADQLVFMFENIKQTNYNTIQPATKKIQKRNKNLTNTNIFPTKNNLPLSTWNLRLVLLYFP